MKRFISFLRYLFSSWDCWGKYIPLTGGFLIISTVAINFLTSEEGFVWGFEKDIFPYSLFWKPVGEGEIIDVDVVFPWSRAEGVRRGSDGRMIYVFPWFGAERIRDQYSDMLQKSKEQPLDYRERIRYYAGQIRVCSIKLVFRWKDSQGEIHHGTCYTYRHWKGGDRLEVLAWHGNGAVTKIKGTWCTPNSAVHICVSILAWLVWTVILGLFLISDVKEFQRMEQRKLKRKLKRERSKERKQMNQK